MLSMSYKFLFFGEDMSKRKMRQLFVDFESCIVVLAEHAKCFLSHVEHA
jgi:hypothetical protein